MSVPKIQGVIVPVKFDSKLINPLPKGWRLLYENICQLCNYLVDIIAEFRKLSLFCRLADPDLSTIFVPNSACFDQKTAILPLLVNGS